MENALEDIRWKTKAKLFPENSALSPTVRLPNRRKRLAVISILRSRTRRKRSRSPSNVPVLNMARSSKSVRSPTNVRLSNAPRNIPLNSLSVRAPNYRESLQRYILTDPFGQSWSIATQQEDVTPEEIGKRAQGAFSES